MNPVTGPFVRSETAKGPATSLDFKPDWLWYERRWYRQRRPYNLPLEFTYQRVQIVDEWKHPNNGSGYNTYNQDGLTFPAHSPTGPSASAYNKAYAKFKSNPLKPSLTGGVSAGLGVNLAQRKQALDMISSRLLKLAKFTKALNRGAKKGKALEYGARALGITQSTARKRLKGAGNSWLEWHFGWSPIIGDIYSSIDVLQKGVPPSKIKASASCKQLSGWTQTGAPSWRYTYDEDFTWTIGAEISVSNPNLWLANQLGLVNPAVVLWDVVPFSFVLNWFVTVEEFLNGFTDFWGLSVTNPYTTFFYTCRTRKVETQPDFPTTGANTVYSVRRFVRTQVTRRPGPIPGPSLRIRDPWILSPSRGATAISLLLQRLRDVSK